MGCLKDKIDTIGFSQRTDDESHSPTCIPSFLTALPASSCIKQCL